MPLQIGLAISICSESNAAPTFSTPNNAMVDEVGDVWVDESGNVMVSA